MAAYVSKVLLRAAALALWPEGKSCLRDPLSKHRIKQYFWSVTEEEISRGMLWREDRDEKSFAFQRRIEDLEAVVKDTDR